MDRIIFHIDVNSAFLSWTSVENIKKGTGPDLREIPAIIGGDQESRHGVVLAKSIPAKKFHIQTGEPIVSALRKCPNLTIFPASHTMYRSYSKKLMNYLHSLTSDIEQVSIDECYLEYTGIAHLYQSPVAAAAHIQTQVLKQFGFTVNIGISSNKLLAKMASDFEKPNKVHTLFPNEIAKKMWPLPVSELYMAGRSSVNVFHKLGIHTIGELANTDPDLLEGHLKSHGRTLWEYANGIDRSPLSSAPAVAKGIGNSTTLPKDITREKDALPVLLHLAESVSSRLRKSGQIAGTLCVEIKYHTFTSTSHQMSLDPPTNTSEKIYKTACELFRALWDETPIRLLGIRSTKLLPDDTPIQLSLFDLQTTAPPDEKHQKLDQALDKIKTRYGESAIIRATQLTTKSSDPSTHSDS